MTVRVLSEKTLATFAGSRGQSVKVRIVEYEGVGVRLDVRRFYVDDHGQDLPTQKGVALRAEWLPQLLEALDVFEREAR